jgi:hypothetical protein
MAIYVGVNGVPKEVSGVYVGVNGAPKEVSDIYAGDSNSSPSAVYSSGPEPGETVFTTSGIFTVPKGVKSIDVFCVGGGGAGGPQHSYYNGAYQEYEAGYGGGAGYTKTINGIAVTPGQQISVTVGAGGYFQYDNTIKSSYGGGSTSIGSFCAASGGYRGFTYSAAYDAKFGYGGSGGGKGANYYYSSGYNYGGLGGKDGADGSGGTYSYGFGKGQGTTTRYFGESSGTLYSTGGCGSGAPGSWAGGGANTGDGGRGGSYNLDVTNGNIPGENGGSGVAIIKWSK